jgi:DNA/RNA endonuclease YhcR with UshA esterase domain
MKIARLFAALAVIQILSARAETTEYSGAEAAKHIGETATVTDKVERAQQAKGGNIFLNMGGAHPNETFTIFIPADAAEKFADFKKYEGATISVAGKISAHGDKPEITVNSPDQITLKEAAPGKDEKPVKTETSTPTPPSR